MAVIGSAEVVVRAITSGFEESIRNDLKRISGSTAGSQAGRNLGESFTRGFQRSTSGNVFGKFADGLRELVPNAEMARERFQRLVRVGYVVQAVLGTLIGGISSLVVSLGTLIGVLGRAAPAVAVLSTAFVTLRTAMATAKFGFGDIASAVSQATDPTRALGSALEDTKEQFQDLQFEAERAALTERRAALNLEEALINLRRTADLPPNAAARREAKLAYDEAELAYRQAKDRTKDLNEEVAKGPEALAASGGTDPFAGLNEAQREFAEYLVTLRPLIDDLELRVSRALLPPLQDATEILRRDLLPILQRELPKIAGETGEALKEMVEGVDYERVERILRAMTEPFNEEGQGNIDLFGELLENVLDIFLQITEATGPLLNDFLTFLVDKTSEWSETLKGMDLEEFFGESGEYAADLGEIVGNVFEGIGNLIGLTTGPGSAGEGMLDWMKESTETFANMFSEDPEAGKQFFADAFENARSVMSSIGALLMEIFKLADNPNIKTTFDTLKEGAPSLGELFEKLIDAGPDFATFLVTVTEIANKLTDDAQISAFFDTLNDGASKFNDFLDSDAAKNLLDNLGPIFATLSALGLIFDTIRFGFEVLVGYIIFAVGILGKPLDMLGLGKKGGAAGAAGAAADAKKGGVFGKLAGGIKAAGIIGLIVTIITKAVEFYNTFEDFRVMVDDVFAGVGEDFGRFGESFSDLWETIFGDGTPGSGLLGALDPFLKALLEIFIPIFGQAISTVVSILTFGVDLIDSILSGILPGFELIGEGLGALIEGDWGEAFRKIIGGIGVLIVGVIQAAVNGIIDLINFGIRQINGMLEALSQGAFGDFMRDVFGVDTSGVRIAELENVDWAGDLKAKFDNQDIKDRYAGSRFGGADARVSTGGAINASAAQANPQFAKYMDDKKTEVNITVNPSAGMDEKELASIVGREIAMQSRKGIM